MSKEDTKRRRAERRAQVARERAERQVKREREFLSRKRRHFKARFRKGEPFLVDFTFSGIPVPVDDFENPDGKHLSQMTDLLGHQKNQEGNTDN